MVGRVAIDDRASLSLSKGRELRDFFLLELKPARNFHVEITDRVHDFLKRRHKEMLSSDELTLTQSTSR